MFSLSLLLILLFGEAINIALHNNIHNTNKVHGYKARLERFYFSCFAAASVFILLLYCALDAARRPHNDPDIVEYIIFINSLFLLFLFLFDAQ